MDFVKDWERDYQIDNLFLLADKEEEYWKEVQEGRVIALDELGNPIKIENHVSGKLQGDTQELIKS